MDIIGIITGLLPYAIAAFVLVILAAGAILLVYYIYRKRGGARTIRKSQFLSFFLLLGWFVVVMGITTFSRGANYAGWFNFRLFSGYVNAWNNWSLSEAQLIVFNMLMFMPLGFLLYLLTKKLRRFWPVLFVSSAVTVSIELFQMLTRRGIFELDDILHNTLGSIAGYFIIAAVLSCAEKRKLLFRPVLRALAIPLAFVLLFSGATIVYHAQELGNMPIVPAVPQNMKGVVVESTVEFPGAADPVPLYHNDHIRNMDYMKQMAALLEDTFALRREAGIRIDGSNRQIAYRDEREEQYNYTFSMTDGSWSLSRDGYSNRTLSPQEREEQTAFFERWLGENGLLPDDAVFTMQDGDTLRWDAPVQDEGVPADYMSGQIMVTPSSDADVPSSLWYFIAGNKFVRTTPVRSPAQAYEAILAGQFNLYNDLAPGDTVEIAAYELRYVYDTKGYYRPAYYFVGTVNGEPWSCEISATA
ncbi:MAG: VanZ family protein [Oscillospiraceae bacterium]|jgi:glycopeptide antibiotics resistance protein|nr:VanZ family protein [Oscillospiraceae bacterium]